MVDKKLGFSGQWVDGTPIGQHVDSDGDTVAIDIAFLEAVVENFNKTKNLHQPPAVIGHPKTDAPAYGYVAELRVNNGRLERRFSEFQPGFEDLVKSGAYKKRSDAFYLDPKIAPGGLVPALRHVGFLGAQPPAIKGITDIHFAEGDKDTKTVDVEVDTAINFSEGADMDHQQLEKTIGERVAAFFKEKFGGKDDKPAAQFSEADRQKLTEEITDNVKAEFSEELKTRDTKIEELTNQVVGQLGSSKRAEVNTLVAQFVEKGILPPALKSRVANFMEALAGVPDKKIVVIEFAEDGVTEKSRSENTLLVEFSEFVAALPPYIQFGEKYGTLRAKGDASSLAGDPEQKKAMRDAMGLKDGGEK